MSTMLKTAAMSLLSKTLQTFLYKYLSDVDVEGVALPSVYDGSGWGVRLSNVKLREGVQLMEQMPGKPKKQRKAARAKKKKTKKSKDDPSNSSIHTAPVKENAASYRDGEAALLPQESKEGYDFPDEPPQAPPRGRQRQDEEDDLLEVSLHFNDLRPTRSRTASTDELEVPVDDHELDDEQQEDGSPSRPSTPLQDSKSIFSCFTKGKPKSRTTTNGELHAVGGDDDDNHTAGSTMPDAIPPYNGDDSSSIKPPVSVVEETPMHRQVSALAMEEKRDTDELDGSLTRDATIGEEEEDEEEEDSDSEDDFEDYEQPYRLCLGDNGRIGTLDIRLIGRELHVRVEDAVLTIEAFPVPEESTSDDNDGEEGDPTDPQDKSATEDARSATSGRTGASSAAPVPPIPLPPKSSKTEPKRDTVGDRVLADNPLARAIAAIPHLFLRDIRIRFIIRKEPRVNQKEEESDTDEAESPPVEGIPDSNQALPGDTMLEVGIEFLSVSSGEDVLSHFQEQTEDESERSNGEDATKPPVAVIPSNSSMESPLDDNEYMTRHIRTGRGPSGGIWVQVFAPGPQLPARLSQPSVEDLYWARQRWVMATDFHLLRCSGLDVRARIHLGEKKQVASYSWFYDNEDGDYEYDYYDNTLDSMVLGFDSIAPGPQLPLPPINPTNMSRGNTPVKPAGAASPIGEEAMSEQAPAMHPGSDKYTRDANGIQSCKIPSTFHRISRDLLPGSCKDCTHLPSETCAMCWGGPVAAKSESTLDTAMPMPGLALQITFRDPLEINVDSPSVDTLHLLQTLFVKKRESGTADDPNSSSGKNSGKIEKQVSRISSTIDDTTKTTSSTSSLFGFLTSKAKEPEEEKVESDAFSQSMQPENIQVLGLHFSDAVLRLHVMPEEKQEDEGRSFRYWDLLASCLTLDYQTFKSEEKTSQDLRFDVGYFEWNELRGVECKRLVSLGIIKNTRDENESSNSVSTRKSLLDDHSHKKSPWPSAACALMDIPPPQETLYYKDRQQHGVQIRFVSVKDHLGFMGAVRSMVNVRLGVTTTRVPWGFWREINAARKSITWGILGRPDPPKVESTAEKRSKEKEDTSPPDTSVMTYSVQLDGGSLVMEPLIDLSAPLTRFAGERSSEGGISFEAILDKLQFAYGRKAPVKDEALSLQQLALLPENVRTRILFCLDDLSPLEEVLELKKEANPFKRTRAVNKGILKMVKKLSKASRSAAHSKRKNSRRSSSDASTRRQKIMTELMKLDNQELDDLWAVHQRHQRKLVKKRATVDSAPIPGNSS